MKTHLAITTVLAAVCASFCATASASTEVEGVILEESALVGGTRLTLNGAGVGTRLMFKVYAMGLYLQNPARDARDALSIDGPRRLRIVLLRDVSGEDFDDAVTSSAADDRDCDPRISAQMTQLGRVIARQPQGLRRGDILTLDWVPGTGTVIELNRRPLAAPIGDAAFYQALLNIWLGEKPADSRLKRGLLGSASS
ncbi:lipoprotein transmembrane [Xylophilus rhododendri]|uniref:Lipoprotein transmembrane n=1 Tax=Xylophilus rhododendri TaxID=2697032 RepID=A0A857JAY0_9BURK|nr:chalcone isomerase family protein [Xylophilus rhododendri]QHJ00302.1 lipoprotein transmembrane [Xylophilus rhododendri]